MKLCSMYLGTKDYSFDNIVIVFVRVLLLLFEDFPGAFTECLIPTIHSM